MEIKANHLKMLLADSPEEAPSYELPEYKLANIDRAQIVGRGTESGKATVDIVFIDESGQKYVAMITGSLIDGLAAAVKGVEQRTG